MAWGHRPVAALLVRVLLACVLGPVIPSPLQAQTCLGFSGQGFLGASGAVRREWSENTTGIGGTGGLRVGPVAATAHYLAFSDVDKFDQDFDFQSVRATFAYEFHMQPLSLCPVLTLGSEGVSSRDFSSFPYRSEPFYGSGLAVGHRLTAPDFGVTIIASLTASIERHVVERLIEGDILIRVREARGLLDGGVTAAFGRLFVRPYALIVADHGWMTGGVRLGLTF